MLKREQYYFEKQDMHYLYVKKKNFKNHILRVKLSYNKFCHSYELLR